MRNPDDSSHEAPAAYYGDSLDSALDVLERQSRRIRYIGSAIALGTIGHFASFLLSFLTSSFATTFYAMVELAVAVPIFSVITFYDREVAKADGLFQEISDELEWHVRGRSHEARPTTSNRELERPRLRARLVLREFLNSTRLPFIARASGNFGGGALIYLLMNLALTVTVVVLLRFFHFWRF
jgi:hypothetical protein